MEQRRYELQRNWSKWCTEGLSNVAIAKKLGCHEWTVRKDIKALGLERGQKPTPLPPPEVVPPTVEERVDEHRTKKRLRTTARENKKFLQEIDCLKEQLEVALAITDHRSEYKIPHKKSSAKSEAVAVCLMSDTHIEEIVHRYQTSGLNSYNKEICEERMGRYFRHVVKLIKQNQEHTTIKTLVYAVIGDLISGWIHPELIESNRLSPIEAILEMQGYLEEGVKYILKHTDLNILIPTASGNHGRSTFKVHMSTEAENSFEYMLYCWLAKTFENEPRVTVLVNKGYHTYVDIWPNYVIRFHHGHEIKSSGGQSGIAGSGTKMIKKWDEGRRADLDCFGHFHQLYRHTKFVCNGSMVGIGAYSSRRGFSPERPQQAFFLIDKSVGMTVFCPIVLVEDR